MRLVLNAGMIAASHTDAPVALPNLMQVMWATVNRTSRSGKVMGPGERLTPAEALKAITLWGAYQHFEETTKGTLDVGKLADMVVLSDNPLTIEPARITRFRCWRRSRTAARLRAEVAQEHTLSTALCGGVTLARACRAVGPEYAAEDWRGGVPAIHSSRVIRASTARCGARLPATSTMASESRRKRGSKSARNSDADER